MARRPRCGIPTAPPNDAAASDRRSDALRAPPNRGGPDPTRHSVTHNPRLYEVPSMSISAPFIRRPIATSLLMLGVLVFGMVAYELLPVAALPNVDFPTITVTVQYPGASPDTMASAVATPLEQQFAALPSLDQMTSFSGIGVTVITMQFTLERNIDGAAQDVQQAINAASGLLPKDLPSPPTYRKTNPADFPVLIYAVHSDLLPVYRIDEYAFTVLAQKIASVP